MNIVQFGKGTQQGIATASWLARVYDDGKTYYSASQIAEALQLPKSRVATALNLLARHGVVKGIPGPGGGYILSTQPDEFTIYQLIQVFEPCFNLQALMNACMCLGDNQCPLHSVSERLMREFIISLHSKTLTDFGKVMALSNNP